MAWCSRAPAPERAWSWHCSRSAARTCCSGTSREPDLRKTVVLNVVGLTPRLIGEHTPNLRAFAERGSLATVGSVLPAVTCSVQSTYLTGKLPGEHGVVGNGWYYRDECEVHFWRQSNRLVHGKKIWDVAREMDPSFTCANLFWWFNMYSSADVAVTPRPMYPADGRKLPDVWTQPAGLRDDLQRELGTFPLFEFWGPGASIRSTRWIANSARRVDERFDPTLSLVYLPHFDYCLQRDGPDGDTIPKNLREVDAVCGDLIEHFERRGASVVVLSEYGITPVDKPVHLNRLLRERGLLAVREEQGRELLDAGASAAFAVADHQVAHVYVNDRDRVSEVRALVENADGVAEVLDDDGKRRYGIDHERAGELVAIAEPDAWFTYYYWLDDRRAPDFARTVDIHRKPSYDPVELFIDPALKLPKLKLGLTLAKKQIGFRYLMDVIPLDASLVKGSHGRPAEASEDGPLFITSERALLDGPSIEATEVFGLLLRHLTEGIPVEPSRTTA